jgi:hypothetical protein
MVSFKIRMWKASWVMLIVFTLLAFLDFYSTFRIGEIVQYLEHNPLFVLTKSWLLIIGLNILALYILLKTYDNNKPFNRFLACTFFVWICALRIFVIYSNFQTGQLVESGAVTIESAKSIEDVAKVSYYSSQILILFYLPMFITLLVYGLFRLDNHVVRID